MTIDRMPPDLLLRRSDVARLLARAAGRDYGHDLSAALGPAGLRAVKAPTA